MDRKKEFEILTEQEKLQLLMKYVPKSVIIKPKTKQSTKQMPKPKPKQRVVEKEIVPNIKTFKKSSIKNCTSRKR